MYMSAVDENATLKAMDVHIGKRLRTLRTAKGKTLKDIAAYLNLSYQQVQKYETGHNRISASALFAICDYLGHSPADFYYGLGHSEASHGLDEETIQVAAIIAAIPDGERKQALTGLAKVMAGYDREH